MRSPLLAAILLVSIILALAIGMVLLLRGAGPSAPIDALPRETRVLLRLPDPPRLWRDLSRTRLAPRGEEQIWNAVVEIVGRQLERLAIPLAPLAPEIERTIRSETILALVPGDREEPEGLAIIMAAGTAAAAVPALARGYTREALGARAEGAWIARSHDDREYLTLRLPGSRGTLSVAGLKGLGIITTSGASMRRILDTLDGRAESLRFEPAYRVTRDRLGRRALLFAYASGAWIAGQVERRVPPGRCRCALRLLGLEGVRGAGLEIDLRGEMFRERLFLAMRRDSRGLPGEVFDAPPHAPVALRLIPAEFPFYLSLSFSGLDAAWRRLPQVLSSATGEDRREIRARLEGLEQFMALDLERDVLGALGDHMAIGFGGESLYPRSSVNRALFNTPAAATVSLRNRSAMRRVLERIDGLARAMKAYHPMTRDGQAFTVYDFAGLAPMSPAYRLVGGQLIAATSPELLARALDAGPGHLSLADREDIDALIGQLPDRCHVFFLGDSSRLADLARPWIGTSPTPGFPPDSAAGADRPGRPDMPGTAATARLTQAGLLLDWTSPISPSLMLAVWLTSDAAEGIGVAEPQAAAWGGEIPY